MFFKALTILVVIGAAVALESQFAERTLKDIMQQPSAVNSQSNENCFRYYIPILNGLSESLDNQINECKQNSTNEVQALNCQQSAEAAYVEDTAEVYDRLADCLEGKGIN